MRRFIALIIFMVFTMSFFPFNQQSGGLNVVGWVYKEDTPVRSSEVLLWEDGQVISRIQTNRWGRFSVDLPLQKEYIISFSAPDLVSKKLSFNTMVPENTPPNDDFYFEFIVELFTPIPWIDKSFLDNPLAIIFYDKPEYAFNYIKEEYELMMAQIETIKSNSEMFDFMGKDYQDRLKLAEKFYNQGDYNAAMEQVSIALAQYPDDIFIKEKIEMIEQTRYNEQLVSLARVDTAKSNSILAIHGPAENNKNVIQNSVFDGIHKITVHEKVNDITELRDPQPQPDEIAIGENKSKSAYPAVYDQLTIGSVISQPQSTSRSDSAPETLINVPQGVVFMVQILATPKPVNPRFFNKARENFPDFEIFQYLDQDQLDKYAIGNFQELNQAMDMLRKLRSLEYETYIIAFKDGKRVSVKEALASR